MKKNLSKLIILLFGVVFTAGFFVSCTDDTPKGEYSDGVFITNEGGFGNNNGSLSFYSYGADSVYNNIFQSENNRSLGDIVQSVTVAGDNVYIVVNNSNKIEIADKNTMDEKGVIDGVLSPRYMVVKNNKGYVSCWGDNSVRVIDLNTLAVTDTIVSTGTGPDKLLISGSKLYVVNSGGWVDDSTITVINTDNNQKIKNIPVPYNPKDLVTDKSGNIWVLSYGIEVYNSDYTAIVKHVPSKLYKIDPSTDKVIAEGKLFADQHPANLEIDNDGVTMYIGGGYTFTGIYKISVSGDNILINQITDDFAYGLNVDPKSGALFVTLSGNYSSAGTLKRYKNDGTLLGKYSCGIGTSGAAFKSAR